MSNSRPVTAFGPDFPFAYDDWLRHPAGLGQVPAHRHGTEVAIMFDTTFAGSKQAQEEITMVLEKDGIWRVAGYYIK